MDKPQLINGIKETLEAKLLRNFGTRPEGATKDQVYRSVLLSVRDILVDKRGKFTRSFKSGKAKRVYYLCMEFLIGRSLKNNLCNLGVEKEYAEALASMGYALDELYEMEPDPGLGNGGLGRLASCFMDSLASLDYPATGMSLCYEYGLFKQKIIDGDQVEMPDVWMPRGGDWLVPRTDRVFPVRFGGKVEERWKDGHLEVIHTDYSEIQAIAYDMMISGSDSNAVNNLRLWKAQDVSNFNMKLFTQGQYMQAVSNSTEAETLTKVLYPSDDHTEGKLLRLSQQYFLVSASLQNIIANHLATFGSLANFAEKVAIHINDTHPALVIPEMMRIFIDTYSFSWDTAWNIVQQTVSYTNHTVLPEALEKWNRVMFKNLLPDIHQVINDINKRLIDELSAKDEFSKIKY